MADNGKRRVTLRDKCPNKKILSSLFAFIWTEYREIETRKNSVFGHVSISEVARSLCILINSKPEKAMSEIKSVTKKVFMEKFNGNLAITINVNYVPTEGSDEAVEHYKQLSNTKKIGQSIQEWTKQNLWMTAFKKFEVIYLLQIFKGCVSQILLCPFLNT